MLSSIQEQRQKSVIQELQKQGKDPSDMKKDPVKNYFTDRVSVKTIKITKLTKVAENEVSFIFYFFFKL